MAKSKAAERARSQSRPETPPEPPAARRPPVAFAVLFGTTLFSGGFLALALVPLFARMLLPRFGDSSAILSVTLVFYFVMVVAGYGYAQLLRSRLTTSRQTIVHGVLALAAFIFLPVALPAWLGDPTATPVLSLFAVGLATVGLPLFVLAASASLASSWYATLWGDFDAYALYAASALGSVVALALYAIAIQPYVALSIQSRFWYAGYVLFIVQLAGCALALLRAAGPAHVLTSTGATTPAPRVARWIVLAAVPTCLMFGVTAFLRDQVIGIPNTWTAPVAVYFATLAAAFGLRRFIPRMWAALAAAVGLVVILAIMAIGTDRVSGDITPALHLATFFLVALYCHMALRDEAPGQGRLTEFYLCLGAGALLGAVLAVIVAPQSFYLMFEYPVALIVAALLLPTETDGSNRYARLWDVGLPLCLALGFGAYVVSGMTFGSAPFDLAMLFALASFVAVAAWRRSLRFGLELVVIVVAAMTIGDLHNTDYFRARNLYGVKHVAQAPGFHEYGYGPAIQGVESMAAAYTREPLASYSRIGPAGALMVDLQPRLHGANVAVVGLGIATLACYAQPGQNWTFYETDPQVVQIATNAALFHYLSACYPGAEIVVGNPRFALAHGAPARFSLLLVDPNGSGTFAASLMTREALKTYLAALTPHGLIAFDIASPPVDLRGLLAGLADEAGLVAYAREDTLANAQGLEGLVASTWVVLAHDPQDLGTLTRERGWTQVRRNATDPIWTDDLGGNLRGWGA